MLSGQRILITGANGGIGSSISRAFLKNNAKLVLFYHNKHDVIDKIVKNSKTSIDTKQLDLFNTSKIDKIMKSVLQQDPIDSFVHCVTPPLHMKNFDELRWSDFQSNIDLQTKSFFQIVQSLLPTMKKNGHGKIVSILTSNVIGRPTSNMSDYVTGKYSLLGLSKALAAELGKFKITINCISPAMTNTSLIKDLPNKMKEISLSQSPLGRLAEPDDIASVALFLCSKYSDYLSGENIIVSSGQTMH